MRALRNFLSEYVGHPAELVRNVLLHRRATASTYRPVFVIGVGRGGSTLVKSIITAHSNLKGTPGETTNILSYHNLYRWEFEGLEPDRFHEMVRASRHLTEVYERVIDHFCDRAAGERFVDKPVSQDPVSMKKWQAMFPDARWVATVRDGRDACVSARKVDYMYNDSVERYAKHWRQRIRRTMRWADDPRFHIMHYERLIQDPEGTVRAFMEHVGEPFEPAQLTEFGQSTVLASSTPDLHGNLTKPIMANNSNKWKREMKPDEVKRFQAIAADELELLGYELG